MNQFQSANEILTRCGFRCDLCPAFSGNIGKLADRQRISEGWYKYFGFRIPPDRIECVGCLNEGRHADSECPVRPCALERKVETCAHCPDFGCGKLKSRMEFAESVIPKFRNIPKEDFDLFFRPYLSHERLDQIRGNKKKR
jgi:hypothetical protein